MYTRPCQSQVIRWNISRCLANLNLIRTFASKPQDDFKILQVSDRRKKERDFLPGIENRKELLKEWDDSLYQNENEIVSMGMDAEEFNAMKADFMDVQSYDSLEREQLRKRLAKIHFQTQRKHFREAKQPKLLTITEIYQIKLLHKENPVEWTVEKLSESFPGTPTIIQKVLSAHTYRTAEQMLRHDQEVKENWSQLQTGTLIGLSPDYQQLLSTFSYREPVVRTLSEYKKFIPPPFRYIPESTEYRSIITSYYDSVNKKKTDSGDKTGGQGKVNNPLLGKGKKPDEIIVSEQPSRDISSSQTNKSNDALNRYKGNKINALDRNNSTFGSDCALGINNNNQNYQIPREQKYSKKIFSDSIRRKLSEHRVAGSARWFSSSSADEASLDKTKTEMQGTSADKTRIENNVGRFGGAETVETIMRREDGDISKENDPCLENNGTQQSHQREKADFKQEISNENRFDSSNIFDSSENQSSNFVANATESRGVSSSFVSNENPNLSSNENLSNSSDGDQSTPNIPDLNRTMHSSKPAYWRQIERERQEKERERERVKTELAADSALHDGKWRRVKPNIGQNTFTPIDQELRHPFNNDRYDNDDDDYGRGSYGRGLDRKRMDMERIRRNKAPTSIMFDEDEEPIAEERYDSHFRQNKENHFNRNEDRYMNQNTCRTETYAHRDDSFDEREVDRSERESRRNEREMSSPHSERRDDVDAEDYRETDRDESHQDTEEDKRFEEVAETRGPLTEGILLNPKAPEGLDINKRMYSRKPPHWDEIMRQRNREERERVAVKQMIEEDMEDKSMYDGRWRRLRPRNRHSAPFADEDDHPHLVPLTTRRMETLNTLEEDSIQESSLPRVASSNSSLELPDYETAVFDSESEEQEARPKFDYYLEEGTSTQRSSYHFTLDTLRQKLDQKQKKDASSLERDEEVILSSYEKKKRMYRSHEDETDSNNGKKDLTEVKEDLTEVEEDLTEVREGTESSASTHMTSYNTRSSQSDLLFTGTVNYTGIVSQGVDITERDVQVEKAIHVELKINIPKELYKENAIYKVNDCFYDDHGEFLYRVPGLKNA